MSNVAVGPRTPHLLPSSPTLLRSNGRGRKAEASALVTGRLRSGKKLVIERTRKFGSDVTNIKGKRKASVLQGGNMMPSKAGMSKKLRIQTAGPGMLPIPLFRL